MNIRGRRKKHSRILKNVFNWLILIIIAIIVGYTFVTFLYQTVTVVGPSMSNTLRDGQVVWVNKYVYKFRDIDRYDIVVYSKVDSDDYYEIKRVVALPEETICIKNGNIYIDGQMLDDLPFDNSILTSGVASNEIKLGKDEYFVIGDNVNNSEDSRYTNIGNIDKSEILGKVVHVFSSGKQR